VNAGSDFLNSKILTLFLLFTLIASGLTVVIVTDEGSDGAVVGDTFTSDTTDTTPVTVTYKITSLDPATVQVGNDVVSIANTTVGTITIPSTVSYDGVTYTVTSLGNGAFVMCTKLTGVSLPSTLVTIKDSAFYQCTSLTSMVIPEGVTTIGQCLLYKCTSLTLAVIPSTVVSIGDSPFGTCSALTDLTLNCDLTVLRANFLSGCTSLTSFIIGGSVTTIYDSAFKGCTSLTSMVIPESVTSIGSYAFQNTGLVSIVIPESVTSIGSYAFLDCASLTSVTVDNCESAVTVGTGAFPTTATVTYLPEPVITYTLSFNGDGVVIDSQTVAEGSAGTVPATPVKNGYVFVGWFQSDLTTAFDFSTVLTADTVAYVVWSTVDAPSDPGLDTSALVCIAIGIVGLICLASCLFRFDWIVLVIGIVLIIVACVIYGSTHQITLPW